VPCGNAMQHLATPTPDPSPQGRANLIYKDNNIE
jgi:hypothetical protein